jgi:uncharacterized membrane protein (UPF0127 family)
MPLFSPLFSRRILSLVVVVAAFLIAAVLYLKVSFLPKVCFDSKCLYLELAKTESQRAQGLMFRRTFAQDRGMLFIFPRDDMWGFWMKNTLIPLDIIWLDKDKKVVDMVERAQPFGGDNPPTFRPVYRSRYCLEVNAGFVKKNDIKVGDQARFNWIF